MWVKVNGVDERVAILIPTRGRAEYIKKVWPKKMKFLNEIDTYIGIERRERYEYLPILERLVPRAQIVQYDNDYGSVAFARERLRRQAFDDEMGYKWFVVTDDNALYSQESVVNLVYTAAYLPYQPAIVAGMHGTARHFDRNLIVFKETHGGFESYPAVSMMFQVYHESLYKGYVYPSNAFGLDDRHLILWAIQHRGLRREHFRVAISAPFTKARYEVGGQGTIDERAMKNGRAIEQLAHDFPRLVGMAGTLRLPWQFIFKSMDPGGVSSADRLPGGSMRKEEMLVKMKRMSETARQIRIKKRR